MKDQRKRRCIRVASAVIGTAALALGMVAFPASAAELTNGTIVDARGTDKYELAAELSGMTVEEVRQLESDGAIRIDDDGFLFFVDVALEPPAPRVQRLALPAEGVAIPGDPGRGSRPGAAITLAIVFDGVTMEGQRWNVAAGADPLVLDGAQGLSDELKHDVWARVAELYAPFNINVITGPQPDDALRKLSPSDESYGALAVVTDSPSSLVDGPAGLAGIAWLGGAGAAYLEGALVFASSYAHASDDVKARGIAETIAHEVGHNFGLQHHGFEVSPTESDEYFTPLNGLWAPVMGISDFVPVSQWSQGDYAHATNPSQGDLETMTDRSAAGHFLASVTLPNGDDYDLVQGVCMEDLRPEGLQPGDHVYAVLDGDCAPMGDQLTLHWAFVDRASMAVDTVGNTFDDAAGLDNSTGSFVANGVVLTDGDRDVYRVTTGGGTFTAAVDVANIGPSLNARLTLFDAAGTEIAVSQSEPQPVTGLVASGLGAQIDAQLEPGVYFLAVEGAGAGDPNQATRRNAMGFSGYGSLGNYRLSGVAAAWGPVAPVTVQHAAGGTEVPGGEPVYVSGTSEPGASIEVALDGTVVATVSANAAGTWAASFTAVAAGPMRVVATQIVGAVRIPEAAALTLLAIVAGPSGEGTGDESAPADRAGDNGSARAKGLAATGGGVGMLPSTAAALVLMLAGGAVVWLKRRRTT